MWLLTAVAALGTSPWMVHCQVSPFATLQAEVDRHPDDPKSWLALARAFETAGREADAARAFSKAKALPEACEALGGLRRYDDPLRAAADFASAAELFDQQGNTPA